jgi:hypothetical protein
MGSFRVKDSGKNIDGVVNITLCGETCLSHLTDYSILTKEKRFFRILSKIRLPVCVSNGEEKRTENSSQNGKKASGRNRLKYF